MFRCRGLYDYLKTKLVIKLTISTVFAAGLINLYPAPALAACAVPNPDKGVTTTSIIDITAGTYRIWSRINAPDSTNNSFMLEIDGNCYIVGDAAIPANTWTWVDYKDGNAGSKLDVRLTQGNHNVRIIGRESNVKLDNVLVVNGTSCTPVNTGTNCGTVIDTTPPTISILSPASGARLSGNLTINATAADTGTIKQVDFLLDTTLLYSDKTAPYAVTIGTKNYTNSAHTILAIAYDTANNNSRATVSVTFNNPASPITTPGSSALKDNSQLIVKYDAQGNPIYVPSDNTDIAYSTAEGDKGNYEISSEAKKPSRLKQALTSLFAILGVGLLIFGVYYARKKGWLSRNPTPYPPDKVDILDTYQPTNYTPEPPTPHANRYPWKDKE